MNKMNKPRTGMMFGVLAALTALTGNVLAGEPEQDLYAFERRREVFEFTEKPSVTRAGDTVTIVFAVKDFCDATVAIEDGNGKILRHLASGALGKNAPAPLQSNTLKQTLVWDGKNDKGEYVDDKDSVVIRVSLGLKPQFERTLFWSPYKKCPGYARNSGHDLPMMQATPEGVYVLDGMVSATAQLRLFDHDGHYARTLHPFPAEQIEKVEDLKWIALPPDGRRFPQRELFTRNTFLVNQDKINDLTVHGDHVYLVGTTLARLNRRGSQEDSRLNLGSSAATTGWGGRDPFGNPRPTLAPPLSAAVSPDGRWLYCTGFRAGITGSSSAGPAWVEGVLRVDLQSGESKPFLGEMKRSPDGARRDNSGFSLPAAVATDTQGRVYVADHINDRIQIFDPQGAFLKTINVTRPAKIQIDPRNGEIWVFSWHITHLSVSYAGGFVGGGKVAPTLRHLGPFDEPTPRRSWPLPGVKNKERKLVANATLDFWTDPPTLWLSSDTAPAWRNADWNVSEVMRLFAVKDDKLEPKRSFLAEARKAVARTRPPGHSRWRLHVNPKNGKLYIAEDHFPAAIVVKGSSDLIEVDPDTGRNRVLPLPFDAEDIAFDSDGHVYLRTKDAVARFDSETWQEVPFDYGEERSMSYQTFKRSDAKSAIAFPGGGNASSQLGGMWVSPKGHVVVHLGNPNKMPANMKERGIQTAGERYHVRLFPGRAMTTLVHVFDKHGKPLYDDALPGVGYAQGVAMDRDDNLYVLASSPGNLGGKPHPEPYTCTLIKVRPGTKILSSGPIPLPDAMKPDRPQDLLRWRDAGNAWIENLLWSFPGLGMETQNYPAGAGNCHCLGNSRFALDYFARSFAGEIARASVAVIDSNGNLIARVGRYGNVDDGEPLVKEGGPPAPRSIGGDEVALMSPRTVAVHTDRRLFIADRSNERILSVRLGYHAEATVKLKDIPDSKPW